MTTEKRKVVTIFDIDGTRFSRNARAIQRNVDKFVDKLEKQSQSLQKVAVGANIALAAQLLWVKRVTNAAARQEAEEIRLAAALKNVSTARAGDVDMLKKQAAALQATTKFGDEQILSAQAMLATFQLNGAQIAAATERVLDMAAASEKLTGQQADLQQIAIAVGKGVTGQVGILSRYGVVISEDVKKTGDFNAILEELDKNFKGIAEDSARGIAGQLTQLQNELGDLDEAIGAALIPIIRDLVAEVRPIVTATIDWISKNQELVRVLVGAGIGGTSIVAGLSSMGLALITLRPLIVGILNPTSLAALGLVALAGAMAFFISRAAAIPDTMQGIDAELEQSRARAESLQKQIQETRKEYGLWNETLGDATSVAQPGVLTLQNLQTELDTVVERTRTLTTAKQELIAAQLEEEAQTKRLIALQQLQNEQKAIANEATDKQIQGAIDAAGQALPSLVKANEDVKQSYDELHKQTTQTQSDFEVLDQQAVDLSASYAGAWVNAFAVVRQSEKNLANAFGKATAMAIARILRMVIESAITEILVTKAKEAAKASIAAPLSFGASLLALAPIAAAAGAGIAAVRALEARIAKDASFEHGGITQGGLVLTHPDEIIFNPSKNTLPEFFGMLSEVAPNMMLNASGNAAPLQFNNYAPITNEVAVEKVMRSLGDAVRNARFGGGY